jgi:hypothetical protein
VVDRAPYGFSVAMGVDTEHQPSNGEDSSARSAITMVATLNRSPVMKNILLAGAATLALSAGFAFAAGPTLATPDPSAAFGQPPAATYGTGGYAFPDDGSPSGDLATTLTEPQQRPAQTGRLSHTYLFPPAQDPGAD